jgi:methionine aminotransferase
LVLAIFHQVFPSFVFLTLSLHISYQSMEMYQNLPQKHRSADISIFSVMSSLATKHQAINLSQGFPDFPIDTKLGDLLHEAATKGWNQYAPMTGLPLLREAIAADFKKRYAIDLNPDSEISITPGATYAIYSAFSAILSPGDEVIVLEPAYDSYIPNIEMNGAKAVPVKLLAPSFAPDWQAIKDAITPKTKAIIINTPHNPTGTIWTLADWNQLADLVRDTAIIILSDEVYEQLVFDGQIHYSVLQHPELRERSFALYSFGKAFHNTGWKMGYCIAAPMLTQAFRQLHQFIGFSVNTPAQFALAQYLNLDKREAPNTLLQGKRDYFLELMKETPFTLLAPAAGSYFQLASYAHMSDLPDRTFATLLTEKYGVATIPISAFYSDRHDQKILRFCFAKKEDTLKAAIERLAKIES